MTMPEQTPEAERDSRSRSPSVRNVTRLGSAATARRSGALRRGDVAVASTVEVPTAVAVPADLPVWGPVWGVANVQREDVDQSITRQNGVLHPPAGIVLSGGGASDDLDDIEEASDGGVAVAGDEDPIIDDDQQAQPPQSQTWEGWYLQEEESEEVTTEAIYHDDDGDEYRVRTGVRHHWHHLTDPSWRQWRQSLADARAVVWMMEEDGVLQRLESIMLSYYAVYMAGPNGENIPPRPEDLFSDVNIQNNIQNVEGTVFATPPEGPVLTISAAHASDLIEAVHMRMLEEIRRRRQNEVVEV